jgi:hypothetical protein
MSGGGDEKAIYDGVSLRVPSCCYGNTGCTGVGKNHWCETPEAIKSRQEHELEAFKKREESLELALIYAQDIVDGWPTLTFRTIGGMTKKVDTLKQALDAVKK